MDRVSKLFYDKDFKIAYLEKKGVAFQDWFVELAGYAFGSDFEPVRPYGNQGDRKCDGRRVSTGTIFQCYAPDKISDTKVISKIDEDFCGAKANWTDFMNVWVFVYNDNRGIAPSIASHIDKLRIDNPNIKIEIWAEPNLYKLFGMMKDDAKRMMFGLAPNQSTVNNLVFDDIVHVIDALQKQEPAHSGSFPPAPSPEKLQRNNLSQSSAGLLSLGRTKARLVETYFKKAGSADLGEKIAEAFNNRYYELKQETDDADKIFTGLCNFAGNYETTKEQVAVFAILAYFFDNCDIFEDLTE